MIKYNGFCPGLFHDGPHLSSAVIPKEQGRDFGAQPSVGWLSFFAPDSNWSIIIGVNVGHWSTVGGLAVRGSVAPYYTFNITEDKTTFIQRRRATDSLRFVLDICASFS